MPLGVIYSNILNWWWNVRKILPIDSTTFTYTNERIASIPTFQTQHELILCVCVCVCFRVSHTFSEAIIEIERTICCVRHVFIPLFASCISLFHQLDLYCNCSFVHLAMQRSTQQLLLDLMELIHKSAVKLHSILQTIHSVHLNRGSYTQTHTHIYTHANIYKKMMHDFHW